MGHHEQRSVIFQMTVLNVMLEAGFRRELCCIDELVTVTSPQVVIGDIR